MGDVLVKNDEMTHVQKYNIFGVPFRQNAQERALSRRDRAEIWN